VLPAFRLLFLPARRRRRGLRAFFCQHLTPDLIRRAPLARSCDPRGLTEGGHHRGRAAGRSRAGLWRAYSAPAR